MPFTTPVIDPIVAMAVAPLDQVPPGVASLRVVAAPTHTLSVPVITAGNELTVTVVVVLQPVPLSV
jgi:hypothetical protein